MTDKLSNIASKSLGDSTSYAVTTDKFDASLLNPMPRSIAREGYGITGTEFKGIDIWNCHEATFLLDNGLPVAGTLKFSYDAGSELMIESKSAKLYLNSFDMCKMGSTHIEAIRNYETQIKEDLSNVLGTSVQTCFFTPNDYKTAPKMNFLDGSIPLTYPTKEDWFNLSSDIKSYVESMVVDDYKSERNHIESIETGEYKLRSYNTNLLRSRCRHTKQKDTGTAVITYNSTKFISPPSLLKQVISLREVNEFHEFCAEKLFVEIAKHLNPGDALNVTLLYARRGSIDINPVRWRGHQNMNYNSLISSNVLLEKTQGQ